MDIFKIGVVCLLVRIRLGKALLPECIYEDKEYVGTDPVRFKGSGFESGRWRSYCKLGENGGLNIVKKIQFPAVGLLSYYSTCLFVCAKPLENIFNNFDDYSHDIFESRKLSIS